MVAGQVRVAVIGAGELGRGWAALCAAHGWPVAVYDHEARAVTDACREVAARARALVAHVGLDDATVEQGVSALHPARSLLDACSDVDWVIEAIQEDLIAKQKLMASLERAAPKARVVSSSSSSLHPEDIAARCRRPDRVFIALPINPPELIPLVEILPGPTPDRILLELFKGWLRALDRIPVTLKKAVRGSIAGRISAAVWREAIQLVLDGAIDVDDLDRAVSVGPALGWVAAGPHLSHHLAAGQRGVAGFVQNLLRSYEELWGDLAAWDRLESDQQRRLIGAIETAYAGQIDQIRLARDRRLAAILQGLEAARDR
jgi:carnitine 3-dehydrogenase